MLCTCLNAWLMFLIATYVGCEQEHCFCKSCLTTHFDTNPTRSAFGESSLFRNSRLFSQGHFESFGGSPSSNTSARCPLDRQVVNSSRMKPAAFVARMIGDLKVKCPYEECAWTGLASDEHEFFVDSICLLLENPSNVMVSVHTQNYRLFWLQTDNDGGYRRTPRGL